MNNPIVPTDATRHPRLVERKDRPASANVLFGGWGPKMLTLAIAAAAVASSTGRSDAAGSAGAASQHGVCALGMAEPVLAAAQNPGWPNSYDTPNETGTAVVRVSVDTSAHITHTAIEKTSGNMMLDREARRLASEAHLVPSDASCRTAPGDYTLVIKFDPGQ